MQAWASHTAKLTEEIASLKSVHAPSGDTDLEDEKKEEELSELGNAETTRAELMSARAELKSAEVQVAALKQEIEEGLAARSSEFEELRKQLSEAVEKRELAEAKVELQGTELGAMQQQLEKSGR